MAKGSKKQDEGWKNYRDYRRGKAKLQNAVLQHPEETEETSVYSFMKKNINRRFWIRPYDEFKKGINKD